MQLFETWTGADFLAFYAVMLITCVGLSIWLAVNLRPPGRSARITDPEEIAILAGGAQRHALAVLAELYAIDAISPARGGKVFASRTQVETSASGGAVLRKVGAFSLAEAMRTLSDRSSAIARDLRRRGALMTGGEINRLRLICTTPFLALLALGLYRQQAGSALGEPTGFLIALLAVTLVAIVVRIATLGPRTLAGEEVLGKHRARAARLQSAPTADEVPYAVGLFGSAVLVGTPFEPIHAMRQASAGGSGSDGGDGGGDGGCGGGCGGCGG